MSFSLVFKPWQTILAVICIFPALALAASDSAPATERRIALIIGNAAYTRAPLVNPVNDAKLLRGTLSSLGFEVIERTNQDVDGMKAAIREFGVRLKESPGSVGLFYFAGHGVQIKGMNYLLPIGRPYDSEEEVEDTAINVDTLMHRITDSGTRVGFVVLDACRDNPFARTATRSLRALMGGLARINPPSGTLVAYSTSAGSTASDGDRGNGLYTEHLSRNMKVPGITAEQMFKRTREGVEQDSGNAQSPREESSLKGADFVFLPVADGRKVNPELVELTYWCAQHGHDFEGVNPSAS